MAWVQFATDAIITYTTHTETSQQLKTAEQQHVQSVRLKTVNPTERLLDPPKNKFSLCFADF